jgi:hypothetical protein
MEPWQKGYIVRIERETSIRTVLTGAHRRTEESVA